MEKFTTEFHVRFHDGDPGLISFYANVYRFAHDAWEDFVTRALGFEYHDWFQNKEWGVPFRRSECDYLKPLLPGQKYRVAVSLEEIRESGFASRYEFTNSKDELCAIVKLVHTFVNQQGKFPIPEKVRARLEAHTLKSRQR